MRCVEVESVDPSEIGNSLERRRLAAELDVANLAMNHYTVPAGERLAGLHAHADQEEVFVVLTGEVGFETLDGRSRVAEGEAVQFPPGEFQSCRNPTDREAVVLALGAPPESDDLRVPVGCGECNSDEHRLTFPDDEEVLVCPDCGAETEPKCPACGGDTLRVVLGEDDDPVERCLECGAATPAR